ncbi:MAG: hypothetical protein Q8O11_05470, partial [Syntrophales bacterium]|nr:hypothetical protein [Syntrophales bacterium]
MKPHEIFQARPLPRGTFPSGTEKWKLSRALPMGMRPLMDSIDGHQFDLTFTDSHCIRQPLLSGVNQTKSR